MNRLRRLLLALPLAAAAAVMATTPASASATTATVASPVVKADARGTTVYVTVTLQCDYSSTFHLGVAVTQTSGQHVAYGNYIVGAATCAPSPNTITVPVEAWVTPSEPGPDRFHNGKARVVVAVVSMGGQTTLFDGDIRIANR